GRGVAVEGLVDLAIGGVDPDLEHLDENAPSVRNVGHLRLGKFRQVDAIWLTRMNCDRTHSSVEPLGLAERKGRKATGRIAVPGETGKCNKMRQATRGRSPARR